MKLHAFTLAAVLVSALPAAHADNAVRPDKVPNKARELAPNDASLKAKIDAALKSSSKKG